MPHSSARLRRRAGFSLIEALVVLAIGGMAMMLVFGIGTRATETGFRLGRLALTAADESVAIDTYRTMIEGLVVVPANVPPRSYRMSALEIRPNLISGDVVLPRDTLCARRGPARDVRLAIETTAEGSSLLCSVGAGAPQVLLTSLGQLSFSVSEDGDAWQDTWSNDIDVQRLGDDMDVAVAREQRLQVRLADDRLALELIGTATSGRPALYLSRQEPAL